MTRRQLVRTRADWIRVLEAIHAPARGDAAWADDVNETLTAILPRAIGVGMVGVEHTPDFLRAENLFVAPPPSMPEVREMAAAVTTMTGPQVLRPLLHPDHPVTSHLEVASELPPETVETMAAMRRSIGAHDVLGIVVNPTPNVSVISYAVFDEPIAMSPYERRLLTQIALHLEAGYRLRRRPEIVVAEISADGKVLHRTGDAPDAARLGRQAARLKRARSREARGTAGAIDLWPALVAGRMSLVERRVGSRGSYLVVENPIEATSSRALTKAEADVVALASRGLSTKLVAYALGVASSTVSARLAAAASKLGVTTRDELVRLAALLAGSPRKDADEPFPALTDAERDVLELLRRGMSNREIAEARSRSVRTIANQVASLLRKTRSGSRRGLLVARL
jgi:DNA-binding CsgD family transcriptional regulator